MALNHAKLPAPLRLKRTTVQALAPRDAASQLSTFLNSDASHLLSGSGGAVRASLLRLVQGLQDELRRKAPSPVLAVPKDEDLKPAVPAKKRRNGDKGDRADAKKRRKVQA